MELYRLTKPITVLSPDLVSMQVLLGHPRGGVEQLGVILEATSEIGGLVSSSHSLVKVVILNS